METYLYYILKVAACSGILLAAYLVLLNRRARFAICRGYLMLIPVLAAAIPLLRIPLLSPQPVAPTAATIAPAQMELLTEIAAQEPAISTATILGWIGSGIYAIGVMLIVGLIVYQGIYLVQLRRHAGVSYTPDYRLIRTPERIASFSFLRSIYVWDQLAEADLPPILAHEQSHIAHHHSVERIAMELFRAAMWWNPFVWIAAQKLSEVHEYEADNDVLNTGYDRRAYMEALFQQAFGLSPALSNGFKNSLTKKRFQMMTSKNTGSHTWLRLVATLPAAIGLLCAFSLTSRAAATPTHEPAETMAQQVETSDSLMKISVQVVLFNKENPKMATAHKAGGIIIKELNGNKGVTTNEKGEATLEVKAGTVLEVMYIDYRSKLITVVPDQTEYTVFLQKGEADPSPDKSAFYKRDTNGVKHTPLYVIDGISQENMEQLNADNIETISVLKGETAAAMYGKRGENGAIIITTKTHKKFEELKKKANDTTDEEVAFLAAETMPQFQDGNLNTFRQWVQSQIQYPKLALTNGIQGRVVLTFVINKAGEVREVNILQSPDKSLSDEVRRIFESVPAGSWKPGMQNGKTVNVKFTLPIDFRVPQKAATE